MITIFNRQELIVLSDSGRYLDIKQCLTTAVIPHHTRFMGGGGTARRGSAAGYHQPLYRIYVHRNDYDRAVAAIQPALRNWNN